MTTPMYTDKEYLEQRFNRLEALIEDTRGDVSGIDRRLDDMQREITSNRLEQVKAGVVAGSLIGISEFLRRVAGP
jgi:hypothetical protein